MPFSLGLSALRLTGFNRIVSGGATDGFDDGTSYSYSYVAGKDAIAFTAGLTSDPSAFTAGPATGGYVGSGAGAPLSSSNCSWNGTTDIKIGQTAGPVYHDNLTISNFDFRGKNYGFTIYGKNIVFQNCIFDMSAWTNNFNTYINVVSSNSAYVSFINCVFNGDSTPYLVKEFISGPVKAIRNCIFRNIPGDWLFSPSRQDTDDSTGTTIEYNYVKLASTSMDTATRIIAPMTGKSWTNLSDNVTISSGFTIRTTTGNAGTSTNGGTITISAGTYTVQNILDTLNATPIVVPSGSAQPGLAANVIGGVIYLTAVAWDNNTATSTARSIDISGDATDIARVFGTGMASQRTSASMGNIPVSLAYADGSGTPATITYYGAHADGFQVPSTYNTTNPISMYATIINMTTDDTTSGSFGQSGNAQQTSPINVTADTGDIYQSVTFDQCTMVISTNSSLHPKEAQGTCNSIAKANLKDGRRFRNLFRISNSLLQAGTSYTIRNPVSQQATITKTGWGTPGAISSTIPAGQTITFWDGTNYLNITSSGTVTNTDILNAFNNADPVTGFWLDATTTTNALTITGRNRNALKPHSNYLAIGGTCGSKMTDFGFISMAFASKAGWATPSTLTATISGVSWHISFHDGSGRIARVDSTASVITGQEILDAINNTSGFAFTASVVGNTLTLTGSGPLIIEGSPPSSGMGTAFGTFGIPYAVYTTTGNGNFINPFSFENNYDYDSPTTPVTITFDNAGVATASWNPKPTAPTVTVSTTTQTTATITFTDQTAVARWQYSLDNGSNWSTLSTSVGGGTVTGTISGLTAGTSYTQCLVRGQNAYDDTGTLRQNGTASAAFTITTAQNIDGFFAVDAMNGSSFKAKAYG